MLILRMSRPDDIDGVLKLAHEAAPGMTSIPADRTDLSKKLAQSSESVTSAPSPDDTHIFFMVLEDTETKAIVGSASIFTGIGKSHGFYSFKISKIVHTSVEFGIQNTVRVLNMNNDYTGVTEVGSLFLSEPYRRDANGWFLATSRYLLMASFPDYFSDIVIAELRGYLDENNESPFWNGMGRKFFKLDFAEADRQNAIHGNHFIADLLPTHPIYVDLLPETAQDVIGRPHNLSARAGNLLEREGFRFRDYIDVFDAGPLYTVRKENITSLQNSMEARVSEAPPNGDTERRLVAAGPIEKFRVTRLDSQLNDDGALSLREEDRRQLGVNPGDNVRILPDYKKG